MKYNFRNKDINIMNMNQYMLSKTLTMFQWENLPETIPVKKVRRNHQKKRNENNFKKCLQL